jgi:hypothetical protein
MPPMVRILGGANIFGAALAPSRAERSSSDFAASAAGIVRGWCIVHDALSSRYLNWVRGTGWTSIQRRGPVAALVPSAEFGHSGEPTSAGSLWQRRAWPIACQGGGSQTAFMGSAPYMCGLSVDGRSYAHNSASRHRAAVSVPGTPERLAGLRARPANPHPKGLRDRLRDRAGSSSHPAVTSCA